MAIIECPECGKKVSSMAALCSHCGFQLGEASEEDRQIFRARKLRDRIYHLNMISYAVITVFLGGFGWYWWESQGFVKPMSMGPMVVMVVSAAGYLIVRALLFRSRQQRKAMRQQMKTSQDLRRNL